MNLTPDMAEILRWLICRRDRRGVTARWTLTAGQVSITFNGAFMAMLPNDMQIHGVLKYVDSKGQPAVVDGVPVWTNDSPTLVTMVTSADGLEVDFAAVGPSGTATGNVTADADIGAGVEPLITLWSLDVVSGKAVTGTVEFSAPIPAP